MRTLLALLALFALSSTLEAQVLKIHFTDERTAGRYKKHLVTIDGQRVLVGEPVPGGGISRNEDGSKISYRGQLANEVFVANRRDPSSVPYKITSRGEWVVTSRRSVVSIPGKHISRIAVFLPDHSLYSLGREYLNRKGQIDELIELRDGHAKASRDWFLTHQRVINAMERLQRFLASTAFPDAAEDMQKEMKRQRKVVAGEAVAQRAKKAKDSVRKVETPERLVRISKEIGGGQWPFSVQESQHVRLIYLDWIGDGRAEELLRLSETAIEGFKSDFVDPYLDEHYDDHIPEGLYHEIFLGPDDGKAYELFWIKYFNQQWGPHKEKRLDVTGQIAHRGMAPCILSYCKVSDKTDFEGYVAHQIGRGLATYHYGGNGRGLNTEWLEHAVAYWVSLEFLGRNSVTPVAFDEEKRARYVSERRKRTGGAKTPMLGTRDYFNSLALEYGVRIELLAKKNTFEIDDVDLAKAWSYYDYLARMEGKDGQLWLRAGALRARQPKSFLAEWRGDSGQIFGIEDADPFRVLDERWRQFAEREQDTSGEFRLKSLGPGQGIAAR